MAQWVEAKPRFFAGFIISQYARVGTNNLIEYMMNLFRATGKIKAFFIVVIVVLVWLSAQLLAPGISNPPVTKAIIAPKAITKILERSCYDCHSNETRLKWYDKIAPVSWKVASDVNVARSRLNFSEWDKLSVQDQETLLWEALNQMLSGNMPLKDYKFIHSEASISNEDLELMKDYVNTLSNNRPFNDSFRDLSIKAAEAELKQFQSSSNTSPDLIPVALNGVKYITGYRKWQVISTTNRFDNNTIRIIYGNEIAVTAIRRNKVNSLPNGAEIVKVVWNKIEDKDGNINTGILGSVQIMIKDTKRFSKTGGWGFGFFNGLKLTPKGNNVSFETTCFNCHKQFTSDNGYLFNIPLKNSDLDPSSKSGIREMYDAGKLEVISSSANRNDFTLSILYGNAQALLSSMDSQGRHMAGEVLTLVTWHQVHNPRWYGSNLNGCIKSIETVNVLSGPDNSLRYEYSIKNDAAMGDSNENYKERQERIYYIISRKPSVFPSK